MSNGRKLVGYGECKCILTQYRDGTCDPIFEDVAQAPVSVMSADECAQDVYKHGQSIGLFDIPKETANAICAGITAITGARVDWHYIAGRVHMKALYAAPVALAAAAPKALPDEPLWDHKGNVRHDAVDRLGERQRAAWKMVRVNAAEFDELMDALQRAEDKGYLPDAMQAEWSAFQFYDASRDVSATAPQASALSKDAIREVFMAHGFTVKEGQTDLKQYVYDAAYALLARATALQAKPLTTGYCKEGENHCVCGGDLPRVREGCGNWVKGNLPDASIAACTMMIKGICMTHPQDQWSRKIEERIRCMLRSQS